MAARGQVSIIQYLSYNYPFIKRLARKYVKVKQGQVFFNLQRRGQISFICFYFHKLSVMSQSITLLAVQKSTIAAKC